MSILNDFKKPVNIISIFLGVIGIILSVIFYYNGKKEKTISFLQNGKTALIFDSKNSSPSIKLFQKDSILITKNVYVLTATIWNSGDISILKEDVRKLLSIDLNSDAEILDFKIIKQKELSVANFSLSKVKENSIGVSWDYFDPKYGFSFQIIYQNNSESNFLLNGKILEVPSFNYLKEEKIRSNSTILNWDNLFFVFILFTFFINIINIKRESLLIKIVALIISIVFLLAITLKVYNYIKYSGANPII
jgi:hypothetical protein